MRRTSEPHTTTTGCCCPARVVCACINVSLENGSVIILVLLKCTQCVRIIYVHI